MDTLVWTLKDNWHFGSIASLLLMFGVGIALSYGRRTAKWGRRWLVAVLLAYWFLSTPFGSWTVAAPLVAGQQRLRAPADASGAQAVVVLSGGTLSHAFDGLAIDDLIASAPRLLEGVRVYRLLGDPLLIVSGGVSQPNVPRPDSRALRAAAISLGVPASRIVEEDRSLTTRDEALAVKPLLAERHIDRFVLVTDPLHMRRSIAAFRAVGLHPIPSTTPLVDRPTKTPFWTPAPRREWLNISDSALYEYVALLYYWSRGWLAAPAA